MPSYKWDPYFGALITAPVPFNVVILMLAPLCIVVTDPVKLRKMNWFLTMIGYFPVSVLLIALYIPANFVMLPFAYLAALAKKIQLISSSSVCDFLVFLTLGWLILLL